mgnify:CR=1 FL=1
MIEFIEFFLFGYSNDLVQTAEPLTAGAIGGIVSGVMGLGQAIFGGAARRRARRRRRALEKQLSDLEQNRQAIINPYAGITDLSDELTNPFANLTVATQAAEMQAQQTDLSLASTLDTLRATGVGSGGATALAQAALSAKQGVSASIAQQEAANAAARAQGQQQLEINRIQEQQRIQAAQAAGQQFMFGTREDRELQKLNRVSGQLGIAQSQEASYESQMMGGIGQAIGGIGSFAIGGGFKRDPRPQVNTLLAQSGLQRVGITNIAPNPGSLITTDIDLRRPIGYAD